MAQNVQSFTINGIITAPCTPFKDNGQIDFAKFEQYAEHILEHKNTCVFANGTTGEGLSMTMEERKQAAEMWVEVSKQRFQLIMNVSCTNILDACELAKHSEAIGVDAISAHSPLFYTPKTPELLVESLTQIAAAAPNTPFYYYDINFMTGVNFDAGEVFKLAINKIPTFRGMKQSSREVAYLIKSVMNSDNGEYQVITGNELLLPALPIGVRIPVCLSFAGRIFHRMVEAFDRGDMKSALREQERIQTIQKILKKYGDGAKKAMTALLGFDAGPSRLPIGNLSQEQLDAMKHDIEYFGIKEML